MELGNKDYKKTAKADPGTHGPDAEVKTDLPIVRDHSHPKTIDKINVVSKASSFGVKHD